MTEKQSLTLRRGNRVSWFGDPNDLGTVIDHGFHAVVIHWDNGQTGTIAHKDASKIEKVGEEQTHGA